MKHTSPSDFFMQNKVPLITLTFWLTKILSTTVGETAADYLIFNMKIGLQNTTFIMSALLALAFFIQMHARKYIPYIYWTVVVMISIVGTLITDNLTDAYHIPLMHSTIGFSIALIVIFSAWYHQEKTLSIHEINTPKREGYYWLAILITFALGTAAGDLISEQLNFGYFNSGILFLGLIIALIATYKIFKISPVLTFWLAYILTRPLGASCGDLLSQNTANGGLGLGTSITSFVFLLTIFILITRETLIQKYEKHEMIEPVKNI